MTTTIGGSYPAVNSDSDATINGLTVGKGGGALTGNTSLGVSSLQGANSGTGNNTAVGYQALYSNTTGSYNDAFGYYALRLNTTAATNSAFGNFTLQANTTGTRNVAVGQAALYGNTTANDNTAIGYASGQGTTTGAFNTSLGSQSLYSNTTASNNTAVGYQAGYSVVTGSYNTFIGNEAGRNAAPTGTALNVAVGHQAGYALTGTANTLLGNGSGSAITSGTKNSVLGSYNGNQGSLDIRTASNYIVLSDGDGNPRCYWDDGGRLNNINSSIDNYSGRFVNSQATRPYCVQFKFSGATPNNTTQTFLDCEDTTNIKAQIYSSGAYGSRPNSYGGLSDIKLKQDIVDASSQWDDIKKVRVRKFRFKDDPNAPLQIGVVAQEIEETSAGLVYESPDFENDENGNKVATGEVTKSVKYSILYMKSIKALQEAMARIETLEAKVTALENK